MKQLSLLLLLFSQFTWGQTTYQKDFNEFWNGINDNYAYLKQQKIDWDRVRTIYEPLASKVSSKAEFVEFLERMLNELYNGHSSLNTNLPGSTRMVPTGMDLFVKKINGKFIITDIRQGSGAELSGLQINREIVSFNDKKVDEGIKHFLPKYTTEYNPEMIQHALNMLFAGTHDKPRKIAILENGKERVFYPDSFRNNSQGPMLAARFLNKKTGYIKINNSLGNNEMIAEFDKAVDRFSGTQNLVIDLTETPSGGNTTVARAMMGRFINKTLPYQRHEIDENPFDTRRYWVEYVIPRKTAYTGKVFILVGHWTGSMGEGIAIGFDGMKRATVIGTRMAGLIGAINGFSLSETKINYQIPTERLYHINGVPREKYLPKILTRNTVETFKEITRLTK